MAYTGINKSSEHFNTKLYTGNGSAGHAITGVGFQPDFTWIKSRVATHNHLLQDSVRGLTKYIYSNLTTSEGTINNGITAVGTDGFTIGDNGSFNSNTDNYASWNWKANGAGSSNTDGNNITSTVSVNTTAGFSIVKYTGTGSASDTIGHGLGVKPSMVIMRPLGYSGAWWIAHKNLSTDNVLEFNTNAQAAISSFGGGGLKYSTFTTSVIGGGNGSSDSGLWNGSGQDYIAYCFAEKTGYSKFGRFTANGNADNVFVYCGFKPAFVMMKCDDTTDGWSKWYMFDTARSPENMNVKELEANSTAVESGNGADYAQIDMLSNGFKLRNGSAWGPASSGKKNIYMAFAEAPLVGSNNVPATAR